MGARLAWRGAAPVGQGGQGTAQGQELLVAKTQPRRACGTEEPLQAREVAAGTVAAWTRPSRAKAISLSGQGLQALGQALVELEADAERAQDLGTRLADEDGHGHDLQDSRALGQNAVVSLLESASRIPGSSVPWLAVASPAPTRARRRPERWITTMSADPIWSR